MSTIPSFDHIYPTVARIEHEICVSLEDEDVGVERDFKHSEFSVPLLLFLVSEVVLLCQH